MRVNIIFVPYKKLERVISLRKLFLKMDHWDIKINIILVNTFETLVKKTTRNKFYIEISLNIDCTKIIKVRVLEKLNESSNIWYGFTYLSFTENMV
jgi:hypothetical protein